MPLQRPCELKHCSKVLFGRRNDRLTGTPAYFLLKKAEKSLLFVVLLFTSAFDLPYDEFDPATRPAIKQIRGAMFAKGESEITYG
jgi:hypothetical protein